MKYKNPPEFTGGFFDIQCIQIAKTLSSNAAGGDGDAVYDLVAVDEVDLIVQINGGAAMRGDEEHLLADVRFFAVIMKLEMLFACHDFCHRANGGSGHTLIYSAGLNACINNGKPFPAAYNGS